MRIAFAKQPRIITHSWEQRKLEDISSYQVSSLTTDQVLENGIYPVYDANEQIGFSNDTKVSVDYLTIIKDGSGVGRTRKLAKNTSFIGTMGGILPNKSDINWLYAIMQRFDFGLYINGATIPHVYYSDYSKQDILVPNIEEQRSIGLVFDSIDLLITLHQHKFA